MFVIRLKSIVSPFSLILCRLDRRAKVLYFDLRPEQLDLRSRAFVEVYLRLRLENIELEYSPAGLNVACARSCREFWWLSLVLA